MGCAPHQSLSATAGCRSCLKRQFGKKSPPRGSLCIRIRNCALLFKMLVLKNKRRPSSVAERRQLSPQGEATKRLTIFAEKMKFAEFFSGKGSLY